MNNTKFTKILIILILIILVPNFVKAINIEEINLNVDIPSEYINLTKTLKDNTNELLQHDINTEQLQDDYSQNNIIFDAISNDKTKAITIAKLQNDSTIKIENLSKYSQSQLEEFMEKYKIAKENLGQTIIEQSIYIKGERTFINSILEQKSDDKVIKSNEYYTIVNKNAITIVQNVFDGEINKQEMQDIIESIKFDSETQVNNAKQYINTYIILCVLGIVLVMFGIYKAKDMSKENPEEKYITQVVAKIKQMGDYNKFGGYIKFFAITICLSVISEIIVIVRFFEEGVIYNSYNILQLLQNIILIVALTYMLLNIKKRENKSIKKIKYSILVILVSTIVLTIIKSIIIYVSGQENSYYIYELKVLLQNIAYTIIWYMYYANSIRVQVFYNKEQLEKIAKNPKTKIQRNYINGIIAKIKIVDYFRKNKATNYENGIYINKISKEINNSYLSEMNAKRIIKLKKAKYYLDENKLQKSEINSKSNGIKIVIGLIIVFLVVNALLKI